MARWGSLQNATVSPKAPIWLSAGSPRVRSGGRRWLYALSLHLHQRQTECECLPLAALDPNALNAFSERSRGMFTQPILLAQTYE